MSEHKARRGSFWGWLLGNRTTTAAVSVGLLVIRLMIGVIFIYHGCQKAFGLFGGPGFDGVVGMLTKMSFPAPTFMAGLLTFGELGGGIFVLLGLFTRLGAAMIATVMIVAMSTATRGQEFQALHAQQMLLAAAIALVIAGGGLICVWPGRFATRSPKA